MPLKRSLHWRRRRESCAAPCRDTQDFPLPAAAIPAKPRPTKPSVPGSGSGLGLAPEKLPACRKTAESRNEIQRRPGAVVELAS